VLAISLLQLSLYTLLFECLDCTTSYGVHRCPLQLHLSSDFIVRDVVHSCQLTSVSVCNTASQTPTVYADHLSSWSTFLLHIIVPQRLTSVTTESFAAVRNECCFWPEPCVCVYIYARKKCKSNDQISMQRGICEPYKFWSHSASTF